MRNDVRKATFGDGLPPFQSQDSEYRRIDSFLLISDEPRDFSLYTRDGHGYQARLGRGTVLSRAEYEQIKTATRGYVYVRRAAERRVADYVERRIAELTDTDSPLSAERANRIYGLACLVATHMLDRPASDDAILRSVRVASLLHQFVDRNRGGMNALLDAFRFEPVLAEHTINVCTLGVGVATNMNLSAAETRAVATAAMLHDIGLRLVPPQNEAAPPDERRARRTRRLHPVFGAERCSALPIADVDVVCAAIRQHHERTDGTGYPIGLVADDVHPVARVVGAVDLLTGIAIRKPVPRRRLRAGMLDLIREHMPGKTDRGVLRELSSLISDDRIGRA